MKSINIVLCKPHHELIKHSRVCKYQSIKNTSIESKLFERQNNEIKTTNFMEKLEDSNNKLAVDALKDPYIFDFITMTEDMNERDIEKQLVKKVTKLLLARVMLWP